jgi:hypothetical protein
MPEVALDLVEVMTKMQPGLVQGLVEITTVLLPCLPLLLLRLLLLRVDVVLL